ncbi:MAG: DUF177 domain-containing protein [Bacilli bacterium]|nr:DUF177 domain-containing protein [Bacilli bacterium]
MNIDITKLRSGIEDYITINETYTFSKKELKNSGILELNNIKINGEITKNSIDDYNINIIVEGIMVLPCSVTLKPVNYDFNINIEGNLIEMLSEFNENYENNQKTIDIFPIIWENILMEIPIRIVSDDISDVKTRGEGWELITEDKNPVNPNLAKLKDLL